MTDFVRRVRRRAHETIAAPRSPLFDLAQYRGGKRWVANSCTQLAQVLQTGDEGLDPSGSGASRDARASWRRKSCGQPHRALRLGARARARLAIRHGPASATSQRANRDAKIRLIRLRREIERHIRPTPLLRFTVDFARAAVNVVRRYRAAASLSLHGGAGSTASDRRSGRGDFGPCGFLSSTIIRSSSPGAGRFWRRSRTSRSFEAQDGAAGFAAFFDLKPDVAVIDINLPGLSGLELLRRILAARPQRRGSSSSA